MLLEKRLNPLAKFNVSATGFVEIGRSRPVTRQLERTVENALFAIGLRAHDGCGLLFYQTT